MRDEAVVRRIAHRRVQDTVHEQCARFLVKLVLHRFAAGRNFDDDVEVFWRIGAGGDLVDTHNGLVFAALPLSPNAAQD